MKTKKIEKFLREKRFDGPKQAKQAFRKSGNLHKGSKFAIANFYGVKVKEDKAGKTKGRLRDEKGRFF